MVDRFGAPAPIEIPRVVRIPREFIMGVKHRPKGKIGRRIVGKIAASPTVIKFEHTHQLGRVTPEGKSLVGTSITILRTQDRTTILGSQEDQRLPSKELKYVGAWNDVLRPRPGDTSFPRSFT